MVSRLVIALVVPTLVGSLVAQDPPTPDKAPSISWKDLTKSGLPIRFYGFFRFDTYYNSARMDSVVVPTRVLPETKRNDDQFHLDPRLTRFGLEITPIDTRAGKVTGRLETDFANFPVGSAESRATPRIRLAYMDIATDEFGLRVGQDWDVISPLYPAANHETLMWNAGNLGDRRAQIQGRYTPKDSAFDLKAALGLTGAVNNQDIDNSGERDGFDSGMPHVQVRAGLKTDGWVEKKKVEGGVWGLYGRTETDTAFNGNSRFDTWAFGIDVSLPLSAALTIRGEAWTGANLGDVRGGIGQTINTTTGTAGFGEEIASTGGFAEVVYAASASTKFHVGASIDDPDNEDLAPNNPMRNMTGYAGTVVDWENGLRTAFDVVYWETEYVAALAGNALRFDLYFQFNF